MNHFSSVAEIRKHNVDMQGEYFNAYACECLLDYFTRMRNKLPLDPRQQPLMKFTNERCKYNVLAIGFSKEVIPLSTIE